MAKQAKILSFDEAQTASRSRRTRRQVARTSGSGTSANRQPSGQAGSRARGEDKRPLRMPSSRNDRLAAAAARDRADEAYEDEARPRSAPQAASSRETRRRNRSKARAEKLYAKQYEGSPAPQQDAQAPRAALYEAKMGSAHRKSARMQRAASAAPQAAKLNPAGWLSNLRISKRALHAGTAVLCLVLVGLFLYTPAQQYYQAQRERDRLAAEYAELVERNESIDTQNAMLASNAGMEDAVRSKYGYIMPGDQTAVVSGLEEGADDRAHRDGVEANVVSSAVKAPEQWYTPYLDAFFGVS